MCTSCVSDPPLLVPQREFDENEVDPFHGKQDKKPEPEAMELPEELNLDQQDPQDGEEDEEGDGEEDEQAFLLSVAAVVILLVRPLMEGR